MKQENDRRRLEISLQTGRKVLHEQNDKLKKMLHEHLCMTVKVRLEEAIDELIREMGESEKKTFLYGHYRNNNNYPHKIPYEPISPQVGEVYVLDGDVEYNECLALLRNRTENLGDIPEDVPVVRRYVIGREGVDAQLPIGDDYHLYSHIMLRIDNQMDYVRPNPITAEEIPPYNAEMVQKVKEWVNSFYSGQKVEVKCKYTISHNDSHYIRVTLKLDTNARMLISNHYTYPTMNIDNVFNNIKHSLIQKGKDMITESYRYNRVLPEKLNPIKAFVDIASSKIEKPIIGYDIF